MKLCRLFLLNHRLAALACLGLSSVAFSQATPPAPAVATPATSLPPLLADLTAPLDISRAKVGTRVEATVDNPWVGNGCNLRKGALIEGRVTQVEQRTKTSKRSAFSLVFDKAECDRHKGTPFKATIFALLGPPGAQAPSGESGMGKNPPLTDVPVSIAGGLRSSAPAVAANRYALTGRSLPTQWHAGMVVDVPMNLAVGAGAEGGSIIWTVDKDARLEGQTTLILMSTAAAPATP